MKMTKRITALTLAAALLLSMVTVAFAAETRTFNAYGADLFSVTNVLDSHVEEWEEDGEVFHDEVLQCVAGNSYGA